MAPGLLSRSSRRCQLCCAAHDAHDTALKPCAHVAPPWTPPAPPTPRPPTRQDGDAVDGAARLEVHLELLRGAAVVNVAHVDCGEGREEVCVGGGGGVRGERGRQEGAQDKRQVAGTRLHLRLHPPCDRLVAGAPRPFQPPCAPRSLDRASASSFAAASAGEPAGCMPASFCALSCSGGERKARCLSRWEAALGYPSANSEECSSRHGKAAASAPAPRACLRRGQP